MCCTAPHHASAASISASSQANAGSTRQRWRRPMRSTCSSILAPTRSTLSRALSSSTSARTAIVERIEPTSFCRARPTPRRPASMSTPRGGRNSPSARCFRPGTHARIGRSCARFRIRSARDCRSNSLTQLRSALAAAYPFLVRFDAVAPADAGVFGQLAALGGAIDKAPFVAAVADFYLTNPIARASRVMAECSALGRGVQREAAE